jgi:hypothetical protein
MRGLRRFLRNKAIPMSLPIRNHEEGLRNRVRLRPCVYRLCARQRLHLRLAVALDSSEGFSLLSSVDQKLEDVSKLGGPGDALFVKHRGRSSIVFAIRIENSSHRRDPRHDPWLLKNDRPKS